jgi:AcrR family transcriptional regulator
VSSQSPDGAKTKIVQRATEAFLAYGYAALSMAMLAELCGLSRRGLYHHFRSKEDLFRATLRLNNQAALSAGETASDAALARGDAAVDVITAWLDTRFGATRRRIGASPHGRELNDVAFRLGTDIMIEVSHESHRKLAELIEALCGRGELELKRGVTPERAARLLGDAARGVNQARPPVPNEEIGRHYRDITQAILFGCALSGTEADEH